MKTLNIRLTAREIEAVRVLRAAGENVSELLRQTLIARAATKQSRVIRSTELLDRLDAIYRDHPGPTPDYVKHGVTTTDRKRMASYIRQRVRRGRGGKS